MRYLIKFQFVVMIAFTLLLSDIKIPVKASAEFSSSISVKVDDVSIIGVVPLQVNKSTTVTVQVHKKDKNLADLRLPGVKMTDIITYQEQKTSDPNGNFQFAFTMKGDQGSYAVNIGTSANEAVYKSEFYYLGSVYINSMITGINAAKGNGDPNTIKNYITNNYTNLYLDSKVFENLQTEGTHLDEFYQLMAVNPSVSSLPALGQQLDQIALVTKLNNCAQSNQIKNLMTTYPETLQIKDSGVLYTYSTLSEDNTRDLIAGDLFGKHHNTFKSLLDLTNDRVVTNSANNANEWGDMKNILVANAKLLDLNFAACNALNNPELVYKRLLNRNFDHIGDIKPAFNEEVENQEAAESKNEERGGTSGGSPKGKSSSFDAGAGSVIPPVPAPSGKKYVDMQQYEWAEDSVQQLFNKGIIKGKDEEHFAPADNVKREEFVKMMVLIANVYNDKSNSNFSDVQENEWYYGFISSAVNANLITGKDKDIFGVGESITREDMATIAYRLVLAKSPQIQNEGAEIAFSDVRDISDYAVKSIAFMQKQNIIRGNSEGLFSPKQYATRAEAAVIISRLMEYLK